MTTQQLTNGKEALSSLLKSSGSIDFLERHPSPGDAAILWDAFYRRVHPLAKIFFEWEM